LFEYSITHHELNSVGTLKRRRYQRQTIKPSTKQKTERQEAKFSKRAALSIVAGQLSVYIQAPAEVARQILFVWTPFHISFSDAEMQQDTPLVIVATS
jgi:hypothetical protein